MGLFLIVMIYPLWYCLVNSLSDPYEVYTGNVLLIPKKITFENYIAIFEKDSILRGFANTILYTSVGTAIGLFITFSAAYPLSKSNLFGGKFLMKLYLLPMFIGGGLVPTFILVKALNLYNTMWALVLPGALGVWNVIVVRTYMRTSIPKEIEESAMLDGANDIVLFFRIILPLCKPILAVMLMFHIVGYWNTYFNALIYLNDEKKYPIQLVLRSLLIQSSLDDIIGSGGSLSMMEQTVKAEGIKYACIIVTTIPMLIIYPVFEKYFDKGMVIGSLKG